jgi:predicted NUDIX family phosphoesterase
MTNKMVKNLKDYELVFVTENNLSIHYGADDYMHIYPFNEAWAEEVLSRSSFVERWMAEKDKAILQIIPYIVCYDDDYVFTYSRKSGGEKRLEGKKSLGIGGHVNIHDKHVKVSNVESELAKITSPNTWDIVINGAVREASEELDIDELYVRENLVQIGTMYTPNDGTGEKDGDVTTLAKVSEVHMAVIYKLKVPRDTTIKEGEGMINPNFEQKDSISADEFEFWSQLIVDNLQYVLEI